MAFPVSSTSMTSAGAVPTGTRRARRSRDFGYTRERAVRVTVTTFGGYRNRLVYTLGDTAYLPATDPK